ncbi:winged helix-turn-helix transcriptional regulator [Microtetraspora sp. AC03309]|uniref:ArsR/SmtB family transcription factor n=1 Tax=Microtetraspora sp. AC03309 TaxID=2779376 RepID=UPI001E4D316A|nr:winged helix-turn-helix domain-containing protein [Microtetraspora sp. AC03309]MCC5576196.1 winged helix-turn-helix transcriptional regulator [Microtetraspora sp. AC03309]
MTTAPRIALTRLAGLLADGTRAAFCLALLDGRAWTAGELARHAGVAPSTASEHLSRLVAGGVLAEEHQGRHRYVRLADVAVAQLIEDMAAHDPPADPPPTTLRATGSRRALTFARTCYDHMAGRLGVAVADALTRRGLLERDAGIAFTEAGVAWLADLLGEPPATTGRRPLARLCLDWTERRPHLAGAAGAALCRHALNEGWVTRIGSGRALGIGPAGGDAFSRVLDIDVVALKLTVEAPVTSSSGRAGTA